MLIAEAEKNNRPVRLLPDNWDAVYLINGGLLGLERYLFLPLFIPILNTSDKNTQLRRRIWWPPRWRRKFEHQIRRKSAESTKTLISRYKFWCINDNHNREDDWCSKVSIISKQYCQFTIYSKRSPVFWRLLWRITSMCANSKHWVPIEQFRSFASCSVIFLQWNNTCENDYDPNETN